jgi:hypothetical protein
MNIHASHNAAIFVEQFASIKLPVDCSATQSPGVFTPKIKVFTKSLVTHHNAPLDMQFDPSDEPLVQKSLPSAVNSEH